MVKKELGIRERRKIYEDTIFVLSQSQALHDSAQAAKNRSALNLIKKQIDRCVSILAVVLGYRETSVVVDGNKSTMLVASNGNDNRAIEKKKFEEIVQELPKNKELKEALWGAFVQQDIQATEKFNSLIA